MKRLFLTVMAVLTMTMTFAENENTNSVSDVNAYDMSLNVRRLGETLGLTVDQMETVADIHRAFCGEMMVASQAAKDDRRSLVDAAVSRDLKYMSYVLTPAQYEKYALLMEATLINRGLK